ncbi:response regulator [Hoeflea olei]|uniref:Uncharacterized protein n=1 Tax=Hoeflea olei TaxID=1480615 RepID=A0A1C1YUB8_9HYPH|nr:response regulator [Hoeflea olei]OCW57124.1 hypothetical protein AWJ14_08260 [Hoeflea olei]
MTSSDTETQKQCFEAKAIEGLASALDIAIIIYDRNDTLIAVTPQFRTFFDVSPEVLTPGARLRDLLNQTHDAGARVLGSLNGRMRSISRDDWIAERIALHWRERYESVEKLADGRWIKMCKRRLPDGILVSTIQDVSEQKRQDAELAAIRQQAELAQHILDNLVNPVMVKDQDLRYVIVNDAFCQVNGLHWRQILGRTAGDLVAPDLAARFEAAERRVLETGEPFDAVEDIYRVDGSVIHAITHARRSGTPGQYYVTVSFDDISALPQGLRRDPDITSRYDLKSTTSAGKTKTLTAANPPPSGAPQRILILDDVPQRAAGRVAELVAAGHDAIAIADAEEALAFLDTLRSMRLSLGRIETTPELARRLAPAARTTAHPMLRQAIEVCLGREHSRSSETVSAPAAAAVPSASHPPQPEAARLPAVPAAGEDRDPPAPVVTGGQDQSPAAEPPSRRVRVLVAEDNDVNQIVFEKILEGIGVDFRIVSNGEEAVAAWRAAVPDLILMDVSMPVMNGLQAAQAIREAETACADTQAHVPIIAVTAHAMSGDKERCFAAGMDDYLSKPVSPEKLETIIRKWVDSPDRLILLG